MLIPLITFKPKTDYLVGLNRQSKYVFNVRSLVQKQSVMKRWFTKVFQVPIVKNRIVRPYKKQKHIKHVRNRRYKTLIVGLGKTQLLGFGVQRLFYSIRVDGQKILLNKGDSVMVQPGLYKIDISYQNFKFSSYKSLYYDNIIN